MNIIKRICAFITGRKLVWLRDQDGEVSMSIADVDPWGDMTAKRWWPFNTRVVILGTEGKVLSGGFVKDWKFVKE